MDAQLRSTVIGIIKDYVKHPEYTDVKSEVSYDNKLCELVKLTATLIDSDKNDDHLISINIGKIAISFIRLLTIQIGEDNFIDGLDNMIRDINDPQTRPALTSSYSSRGYGFIATSLFDTIMQVYSLTILDIAANRHGYNILECINNAKNIR